MWERLLTRRGGSFMMLGVAQDAQGEERVLPVIERWQISYPILIDRTSLLGRLIGFRAVPFGAFIDPAGFLRYRHDDDFDARDPRFNGTSIGSSLVRTLGPRSAGVRSSRKRSIYSLKVSHATKRGTMHWP